MPVAGCVVLEKRQSRVDNYNKYHGTGYTTIYNKFASMVSLVQAKVKALW